MIETYRIFIIIENHGIIRTILKDKKLELVLTIERRKEKNEDEYSYK